MTFPLPTGYDPPIVVLSILIAGLASYATLDLVHHVNVTRGYARFGWLLSGAIAMGIGIWAMHFIGMLAFRLPIPVTYSVQRVMVSVVPGIIASGLALFLVRQKMVRWRQLLGASLCLGTGITSMHYLGMMAMQMAAIMQYNWFMVAGSAGMAIAVSAVGLSLAIHFRETRTNPPVWQKLLAAAVMGAAIPTMHYTGMAAAQFTVVNDLPPPSVLHPPANFAILSAVVSLGSSMILGFTLLAVFVDRRMSAQATYTQAVQVSHAYLQSILRGVQVGVVVVDAESNLQMSNQAILALLHLDSQIELQNLWHQVQQQLQPADSGLSWLGEPPENCDPKWRSLWPLLGAIATHQSVQNAVVPLYPTPNTTTYLLINAVQSSFAPLPQFNPQTVCTFNDISELKQTETLLKQSTVKFQALAQQEEILNRLSTQIRQSLDLQTTLQTAVSEIRRAFESDRALIYQFDPDRGGQVILEDRVANCSSALGIGKDDCFPSQCLERYKDGNVKAVNNVVEAGFHLSHLQFLQSLQIQANLIAPIIQSKRLWGLLIVHQCDQPRVWKSAEKNLLSRLGTQIGIAIRQAELYANAEQNAQQAQAQAQSLQESETKLKQKTQALEDTLKELQELQLQLVHNEKMSALGQLVAGVAHEINNPLSFIRGNLDYAQTSTKDLLNLVQAYQRCYPDPPLVIQDHHDCIDLPFLQEDLPKSLQSMRVGAERIRQIVQSLHIFSRTDQAEIKAVDIHEGIDSSLMILQHRLKGVANLSEVEVIRDYGELPLVECYPGPLNQVFMNILVNALDALDEQQEMTPALRADQAETRQIIIRTSLLTHSPGVQQGQWVEVAIADNGPGIPSHLQQRIFDPFFTTKPVGKGTGLGMSISHQIIIEKHRGQLKCNSTPGQGTEFIIQIPTSYCH